MPHAKPDERAERADPGDGNTPSPRLLLLDDEESILRPIAHYFRELKYAVVTAQEPEEAEALLDHQGFDLVILDLALTRFGREGMEVLRSLRADHPLLPVIVMSGNVTREIEGEALALGARAVLCKPQALANLAAIVGRILGR